MDPKSLEQPRPCGPQHDISSSSVRVTQASAAGWQYPGKGAASDTVSTVSQTQQAQTLSLLLGAKVQGGVSSAQQCHLGPAG